MKFDSFKCDVDGTVKGDTNHWFKFTAHDDQFTVTDWNGSDYTYTQHLCSDACVILQVQKWLSAQKEVKDGDSKNDFNKSPDSREVLV